MLKRQAGKVVELPTQANGKHLEDEHRQRVREVYQSIHSASLNQFKHSWIDTLWNNLTITVRTLDDLPEAVFKELIEVLHGLDEARNELRLARFLFNVEEINSVHRLVMRNRAVLRSGKILRRVLDVWPLRPH